MPKDFNINLTPLERAVYGRKTQVIEILLENGADPKNKIYNGLYNYFPSLIKRDSCDRETVKMLLLNGFNEINDNLIFNCILSSFIVKDTELSFILFRLLGDIALKFAGSTNLLSLAYMYNPDKEVVSFLESKMKPFREKN